LVTLSGLVMKQFGKTKKNTISRERGLSADQGLPEIEVSSSYK